MSRPKFIAFSPKTQVTNTIAAGAVAVEVDNIGSFPNVAAGQYGYITFLYDERGSSENPADYETATYTGKSGNELTGLTRGVEGVAQEWVTGKYCFSGKVAHSDEAIWLYAEGVAGDLSTHESETPSAGVHGIIDVNGQLVREVV